MIIMFFLQKKHDGHDFFLERESTVSRGIATIQEDLSVRMAIGLSARLYVI